ncbi:formate--tetrahydrofolate ligase [Malacoplasma muris]|uniref:formate--tetrahydrofolate ligase n=1 Tax=Malacoplasma muris TaxID=2119 RepID=UPI00398F1A3A
MKNIKRFFDDYEIIQYGNFYKVNLKNKITFDNKKSKLILVTSINPTPTGEGKTTTLIGLNDCFNYYGYKSIAALRQPSMGPFFGIKGGATGSGNCELINANKINCGFTGDFFAIEAANNLIMSIIENEIYQNSSLEIDESKILWNRCIDMNDRSLRKIEYSLSNKLSTNFSSKFNITAASYLMASFCLAKSKLDFKNKLLNTIVAFNKKNNPVYVKDLDIIDSIMMILDDALNPNLAFSKYNNPVLIHGGPFANIAHGCNTVIATELALSVADYTFTESGFGIDLGAEKFLNIKTRELNKVPNLVVIAVTIKSLKYHGGTLVQDLNKENLYSLETGFSNLLKNIDSIKSFGLNYVVVINKFNDDTQKEIDKLLQLCKDKKIPCELSTMWQDGPKANKHLIEFINNNLSDKNVIKYTYKLSDSIIDKAKLVAKTIYGADGVNFSEQAINKLKENQQFIQDYYICFAKTFSSLSDDAKKLNVPKGFTISINDVEFNHSARFVILITTQIFLMPGLPKIPNAKRIRYEFR